MRRVGSLWGRAATATLTVAMLCGAILVGAPGLLAGCSGGGRPGTSAAPATSTTAASPTSTSGSTGGTPPAGSAGASTTVAGTGPTTSGGRTTATTTATGSSNSTSTATVSASSGGLTVNMTVAPTRARHGAAIDFTVAASDNQGFGFFGYRLTYGDGASEQNVVPHNCPAATPESGAQHSWHFTHQYQAPGTYTASVHVLVTCIGDQLTAPPVTLVIS